MMLSLIEIIWNCLDYGIYDLNNVKSGIYDVSRCIYGNFQSINNAKLSTLGDNKKANKQP